MKKNKEKKYSYSDFFISTENRFNYYFTLFFLFILIFWGIYEISVLFTEFIRGQIKINSLYLFNEFNWSIVYSIFPNFNADNLEKFILYSLVCIQSAFLILLIILWQVPQFLFSESEGSIQFFFQDNHQGKKSSWLVKLFKLFFLEKEFNPLILFRDFIVFISFLSAIIYLLKFFIILGSSEEYFLSTTFIGIIDVESLFIVILFPFFWNLIINFKLSVIYNLLFLTLLNFVVSKLQLLNSDFLIVLNILYIIIFFSTYFYSRVRKKNFHDLLEGLEKTTRDLIETSSVLKTIQVQNQNIMNHIHDGIILLDRNFNFLETRSNQFNSIFEVKGDIKSKNFLDFLKKNFGLKKELIDYTKRFFNLLLNKHIPNNVLTKANPLEKIEFFFKDSFNNVVQKKWLNFRFTLVELDNDENQILTQITDRTDEENLKLKIKNEEEKKNKEIKKIAELINSKSSLINNFFYQVIDEVEKINVLMQRSSNSKETFNKVYFIIHALKGKASILKLNEILYKLVEIEGNLNLILGKKEIELNESINLVLLISQLKDLVMVYYNLGTRIGVIKSNQNLKFKYKDEVSLTNSYDELVSLIKETITTSNPQNVKNIKLVNKINQKVFSALSKQIKVNLTDIIIQLIKNSLSHAFKKKIKEIGFKPEITLVLSKKKSDFLFNYQDNGDGVDLKSLQELLKKKKNLDNLSKKELLASIFQKGVSTSKVKDINSGQGMGMAMIKEKVENILNGKLKLKNSLKKAFIFEIKF